MKVMNITVAGVSLVFFITLASPVISAASGLELNKAIISQERSEGEPTETVLRLNSDAGWDWLQVGLTGKFLLVPVEDIYSSCDIKLIFPELTKSLVVKSGFDWNEKYKIYNGKLNYNFFPFKTVRTEMGCQIEERKPELATGCPYRFNNESIAIIWQQKPWKYSFNLTRKDKDYYEDNQYTSLKYQMGQALTWHPQNNIQLQAGYEENTGDYITSGYKDYWKKEWSFDGKYKSKDKWRYELEYRKLFWERGYEPYRSSHRLQFKMGKDLNRTAKLTLGATYRDLKYDSTSQDYSEPGVYYKFESDLKSRVESKAGMELQLDLSKFTWRIGPFWGYTDYDSASVKDTNRVGIYAIIIWSHRKFEVTFKMAPRGDFSTQDAYYLLEIAYKPREKEAVKVE